MSATRDKNQKIGFVYSNLYQIYKQGTPASSHQAAPTGGVSTPAPTPTLNAPLGLTRGRVIKAGTPEAIQAFKPTELLGKRIEVAKLAAENAAKPVYVKTPRVLHATENHAVKSLKHNLEKLSELHSRLRFMLQELEDLVKE